MGAVLSTVTLRPDDESGALIAADTLAGEGPALVFLHGMTSTRIGRKSEALLERARSLGRSFARFDFRGHGDSTGEIDSVTITDLIADTAAVVEHVGPSVLVGSSMGALAAAWFATQHPERVAALVLLAPALGFLPEMARQADSFELRRSDESPMTLRRRVLEDARRYDEAALPRRLGVPLMVIHGSEDRTVAPRLSDRFCRQVPHRDKELWVIEGGSHSLNEDIDTVLDRIESFLRSRALV